MGTGMYGNIKNTKEVADNILGQLSLLGVKFNTRDLIFAIKDSKGQIVWLEKGNEFAGMKHIIERHAADFANKHGVNKENLSEHIKNVISNGKIEYSRLVKKGSSAGYEKLISYKDKFYTMAGIGTNGYLVTCYPVDSKTAKKLIERYKNDK